MDRDSFEYRALDIAREYSNYIKSENFEKIVLYPVILFTKEAMQLTYYEKFTLRFPYVDSFGKESKKEVDSVAVSTITYTCRLSKSDGSSKVDRMIFEDENGIEYDLWEHVYLLKDKEEGLDTLCFYPKVDSCCDLFHPLYALWKGYSFIKTTTFWDGPF